MLLKFIQKKKEHGNNQENFKERMMMRHTFPRSIKLASNMKLEVSNYHSAGPRVDIVGNRPYINERCDELFWNFYLLRD